MKRIDLERHLKEHGCVRHQHGGKHDIWLNPLNFAKAPIPRHKEIKKATAKGICSALGIPKPDEL